MDSARFDGDVDEEFLHDHNPSGIHSTEFLLLDNPLDGCMVGFELEIPSE
jgi:hypothetical protein